MTTNLEFKVQSGEAVGKSIIVANHENRLGREQPVDIHIPDPHISRTHAFVVREGDRWFIIDKNSTGGTFIGNQKLLPEQKYPLDNNSILTLGNVEVLVRYVTSFFDPDPIVIVPAAIARIPEPTPLPRPVFELEHEIKLLRDERDKLKEDMDRMRRGARPTSNREMIEEFGPMFTELSSALAAAEKSAPASAEVRKARSLARGILGRWGDILAYFE